ncbi:serine/threonine-protein phosphatase [Pantoea sp. XY16]|uniref:PP2C family protein-serine/threonine phosphatase n=1 Tax=Pantoea sp. XY16 TaxID=2976705 RepID=UPI0021A5B976|nr:PP2C family serine/threonine-protein phosphatase [Pantoea sp. XY16]MCT2417580.1 serine/threonine-protein phosphatase [Pantoea sp. XY16]
MLIGNKDISKMLNDPLHAQVFNEIINASFNQGFTIKDDDFNLFFSTHPGLVRKRNEDRLALSIINFSNKEYYFCALLCDGVGGSEFGDIAASLAISTILTKLSYSYNRGSLGDQLTQVVQESDKLIREVLSGRGATTLSLFLASSSGETIALNIGDSRVYSWQPSLKNLNQISIDDTLENELAHLKIKDMSALKEMKLGGTLSQALGEKNRSEFDLNFNFHNKDNFPEGFILASDGAWKESEEVFLKIIKNSPPNEVARRVVISSNWLGGGDNSSVIAVPSLATLQQKIEDIKDSYFYNTISLWCGDCKTKFALTSQEMNVQFKKNNYKKSSKKISSGDLKKKENEKKEKEKEDIIIEEFHLKSDTKPE